MVVLASLAGVLKLSNKPLAQPPPTGNPVIDRWLFLLWKRLLEAGIVDWAEIDLTGSDLADLAIKRHVDLTDLNTDDYTHLTAIQAADLTDGGPTTLHSHSFDLTGASGQLEMDNAVHIKAYASSHG